MTQKKDSNVEYPNLARKPEEIVAEREALKALQDWSKWMVLIQTTVIGFGADAVEKSGSMLGLAVIGCFVTSITAGTILVGAIPSLLERSGDPWPYTSFCGWPLSGVHRYKQFGLPLLAYAFVEHACFIVGTIAFGVFRSMVNTCLSG